MNQIILTILIMENLLLLGLFLIWKYRHCQKCQQVKCIERIFNRLCKDCKSPKKEEKPAQTKEEIPIF